MDPDLLPKDSKGAPAQPAPSKSPLTKQAFKKMNGGKLGLIFRLDPKKVQHLANVSTSLGRQALDQWQGIRQVLGDEKFDALFGPTSSFKLMIAARRSDNPLNRLRIVTSIPNKQEIQLGDMVYIPNDPEYPKCDPFGPGTGYNAICIKQNQDDEPKFTIHGLNAKGATLDEVANDLYQELQKDPTILEKDELPEAAREDIRLLPKLKPKPKISFKEFTQRGGGALLQNMWIDPAKVTILKELSVENGMKMLSTWRPQIQL